MGTHRPNPLPEPQSLMASTPVVVVGIDGSDTSWDAFWWACGEVRRLGGRLVAVFVSAIAMFDPLAVAAGVSFAAVAVEQVPSDQRATRQAEQLRGRVERCAADANLAATFVHAHGDATNELLQVAQAQHADLIVVGKSTKARHNVAGSLGRRLIGKRDVPVVVVVP
jgi:nucleotide-binding universal stress UspA family protein